MVGVNIGKTRAVPDQEAAADYATSARAVADVADYVVVNVSSPNTPGLRDLQATDRLRPVLVVVRSALDAGSVGGRRVPLLVKIAPDLAAEDVDAVADLAVELGLDGVIATNTTVARDGLASSAAEVTAAGAGGLSGPPLREPRWPCCGAAGAGRGPAVLIAAGGIETPDDAWERLTAGATLVQAYTGFIMGARCGRGACMPGGPPGPGGRDQLSAASRAREPSGGSSRRRAAWPALSSAAMPSGKVWNYSPWPTSAQASIGTARVPRRSARMSWMCSAGPQPSNVPVTMPATPSR